MGRLPRLRHAPSPAAGTAVIAAALCQVPIDFALAAYAKAHPAVIGTFVKDGAEQSVRGTPPWLAGLRLAVPALTLAALALAGRVRPADAGLTLGDPRITLLWLSSGLALFLALLLAFVAGRVVVDQLDLLPPHPWLIYPSAWGNLGFWTSFFHLCLLYPLVEEALYRGIYAPALECAGGPALAVLGSGATWVALHLAYGSEPGATVLVFYFACGVLLTVVMLRARSLAAPLALHGLINLITPIGTDWLKAAYPDLIANLFNVQNATP